MSTQSQEDVLVIGESIMDLIRENGTTIESPGGSAANVALGLGRLGVNVEFLTSIASDHYGQAIASHLEASGVHIAPRSFNAARTSTALASLDSGAQARYEFDVSWTLEPLILQPPPRLLHVGSIAAFSCTDGAILRDVMIRMSGAEITFDPNVRPALLRSRDTEIGIFEDTAALATVIKLSDEDAKWLYPNLTRSQLIGHLLGLGPLLVVLTLGAAGSLIAGHSFEVEAPAVSPSRLVDTIGAGDTYMATMIRFLLEHKSSTFTAVQAAAMGNLSSQGAAITVSRRGADLPTVAELTAR